MATKVTEMGAALGWGGLAASSLALGALLGVTRRWSRRQVGLVLAFGAGALISAVSFELAEEAIRIGDAGFAALGLGLGALTYYGFDGAIAARFAGGRGRRGRAGAGDGGTALALGAFLDGIPEQLVLGIGLAAGQGVSVALLVAIFVSNLPESLGSSQQMATTGVERRTILRLWLAVAAICTLASVAGFLVADAVGHNALATIDGFAAGALLVMLIDSMIPDARSDAGRGAGLVTVLGFALAAALSNLS